MTTEAVAHANEVPAETIGLFFTEAETAVAAMAGEVTRIAELFRSTDSASASQALSVIPLELRNFIVMMSVLEGQLGIEPAALTVDGLVPSQQITRLGGWLESLVEAQRNEDALTIADILEFDLEPFLRAWAAILANQAR